MQKHYEHLKEDASYWPDNSIYFLTDSTFLHFPFFRSYEQKNIVYNQIKKIKEKLNIPISAYSIACNHYHLKFYLENGKDLAEVKRYLRGGISHEYKKKFRSPYKEIWQTRKILRVISEEMDWKVTGYIIGNLLKHREVGTFKELEEDDFSSYWYYVEKYGKEDAEYLVRRVIDIAENVEGEIDFIKLNELDIKRTGG